MFVSTHIDGGVCSGFEISGNEIVFDQRPKQTLLHVLIGDIAGEITLHFQFDDVGERFVARQGILLCEDGINFLARPLEKTGEAKYSITLSPKHNSIRIATRLPYGRDAFDQLLCDLHGAQNIRPFLLREGHRSVPLFECGVDDGIRPVHYVIAGEDVSESGGTLVADQMLRLLAEDGPTVRTLLQKSVIRIVPIVSLFCAARTQSASYNDLTGNSLYGASRWADENPPPEFKILRTEVEKTIAQKRLGLLLCIHCWLAEQVHSEMEYIRSSGENSLPPERDAAAHRVLEQLMQGFPEGRSKVAEKIWFPGLARDYLMKQHDVVSYRLEVTTAGNPAGDYREHARVLLDNLNLIDDWSFVFLRQS